MISGFFFWQSYTRLHIVNIALLSSGPTDHQGPKIFVENRSIQDLKNAYTLPYAKIFLNLYPPLENSTTLIAIGDMILKLRFLYVNVSGFNLLAMIGFIVKYVRNSHGSRTRQYSTQCTIVLIKSIIYFLVLSA